MTDPPNGPKAEILAILDEDRIASVATLRPDGWPQATMVGYVHDDLSLYFSVARASQKAANIRHDPRVSVAVGHDRQDRIRGLSMAGHAHEVEDVAEIRRLNALIARRYPEQAVFAPREAQAVVIRFQPRIVSLIDLTKGPGAPLLFEVVTETHVESLDADRAGHLLHEPAPAGLVRPVPRVAGLDGPPI